MKNLYNLIKKLSQSEKRYIKLRLQSTKAESQSILYFDFITKQKEYDFDLWLDLDNKTAPVLRSNLDKLYRSILKQLRIFHSEGSPDFKLQGVLMDVRLLQEKGLVAEARKLNTKLIKYSKEEEQFHILKKSLSNQWRLFHLSGMLTNEIIDELEFEINYCRKLETELEDLNVLYRKGVGLYYSYFFKEKKPEYIKEIGLILKHKLFSENTEISSSSAKMVCFEIKALCKVVLGDVEGQHFEHKKQLELLFTSDLFERDYTKKLLVINNVFKFLKLRGKIKEFRAYLGFFEQSFSKIFGRISDNILAEKYYDIYFQNKIYQQQFDVNKEEIEALISDFTQLVCNREINNKRLISRTYLSLSELLVLSGIERKVIPLLIEYQDWNKANKSSNSFINSELLFLVVYWKREKLDSLGNKLNVLEQFVKSHDLKLDYDQNSILGIIKHKYLGTVKLKVDFKRVKKISNKIIIDSLSKGVGIEKQAKLYFTESKEEYLPENDLLLEILNKLI